MEDKLREWNLGNYIEKFQDTQINADDEHLRWLRHNREPVEEIYNNWDATFTSRRQKLLKEGGSTEKLFEQYPILKEQVCLHLVERNFGKIFANESDHIINFWESVVNKLIQLRGHYVSF